MTLKLEDGQVTCNISLNITNAIGDWTISLTSQLSNMVTFSNAMSIVETNDRYTEFMFDIPVDLPLEHKNGIYDTIVTNGVTNETFLLKLVCGSGGTDGTVAYTSDNENREAPVYYRPQY